MWFPESKTKTSLEFSCALRTVPVATCVKLRDPEESLSL